MRPGSIGISRFPLTVPPDWWIPSQGILLPTSSAGRRSGFVSSTLAVIDETKLLRFTSKALRICARAASRTSRPPARMPVATAA